MSNLPTLKMKNTLVPVGAATDADVENIVAVEFVMQWFNDRRFKTGIQNRFLVLKAETASGKSTAFPTELFATFVKGHPNDPGIICTQPRTITAIRNVLEILPYAPFFELSENIGWSTKDKKNKPRARGSLLSATVGTLAQQFKMYTAKEIMAKYRFILIDEVHERDLAIDSTLYFLKEFLVANADNQACPFVVFMSATFSPERYLEWMGGTQENYIYVRGKSAAHTEMWDWIESKGRVVDYTVTAAECVEHILAEELTPRNPRADKEPGDILIFLPGSQEITAVSERLEELNRKLVTDERGVLSIIEVMSETQKAETERFLNLDVPIADQKVSIEGVKYKVQRRVVLSSNVAETGLTLSEVKYVIDAGYNREVEYNPIYRTNSLLTRPCPQSRITQRRGRAGRKFPGVFYPLYTRDTFDSLQKIQYPSIVTSDISIMILDLLDGKDDFDLSKIDLLDLPPIDSLLDAYEKAYALGFIDTDGTKFCLSELGRVAAKVNTQKIELVRMILASWSWNISTIDCITIAAYLSKISDGAKMAANKGTSIDWYNIYRDAIPTFLRINDQNGDKFYYRSQLLIADDFINGIILLAAIKSRLAIYDETSVKSIYEWCEKVNLSAEFVFDFIRRRDELIEEWLTAGFNIFDNEAGSFKQIHELDFMSWITKVKHCIYEGFRLNLLVYKDGKYYARGGVPVKTPKIFNETKFRGAISQEFNQIYEVMPRVLLYNNLSMMQNRNTHIHEFSVDCVSTMDGYVSVDSDFL